MGESRSIRSYRVAADGRGELARERDGDGNDRRRPQRNAFSTIDQLTVQAGGALSYTYSLPPSMFAIDRNTLFRVELAGTPGPNPLNISYQTREPSFSEPVRVYVLPAVYLLVSPKTTLVPSPTIPGLRVQKFSHRDFTLHLELVSPPLRHYHGQRAYVYEAVGRGRTFHRIAAMRTRSTDASVTIDHPGLRRRGAHFMICVRRQLVANMGPQFSYPACGRRTLLRGGPVGAQFLSSGDN